jgi:hypothetical protein
MESAAFLPLPLSETAGAAAPAGAGGGGCDHPAALPSLPPAFSVTSTPRTTQWAGL